jgi:hypothetical protein
MLSPDLMTQGELKAEVKRLHELKTPASRQLLNITKALLEDAEKECVRLSTCLYNSNAELLKLMHK